MPYAIRLTARLIMAAAVAALVAWSLASATAPAPVEAQLKGGGPWTLVSTPAGTSPGFTNCSGFGSTSDVIVQSSTGSTGVQQHSLIPGNARYLPVTCDRAYTANLDLYNWRQMTLLQQTGFRRKVQVSYRDPYTGVITQRWDLNSAWPSDYFVAFDREVVTFVYDSAVRVP